MKKSYFLILSLIILSLSISYVSASDDLNSTDTNATAGDNNSSMEIKENSQLNSDIANSTEVTDQPSNTVPNKDVNTYKEPTKKQRTFKIGKFKAVLSKKLYKKLFKIKSVDKLFLKSNISEDMSTFKGYKLDNGFYSLTGGNSKKTGYIIQ